MSLPEYASSLLVINRISTRVAFSLDCNPVPMTFYDQVYTVVAGLPRFLNLGVEANRNPCCQKVLEVIALEALPIADCKFLATTLDRFAEKPFFQQNVPLVIPLLHGNRIGLGLCKELAWPSSLVISPLAIPWQLGIPRTRLSVFGR